MIRRRKKAVFLGLLLVMAVAAGAQTVDSIFANYMAFSGGAARWKAVTTLVTAGTYNYGGLVFPFTTYSKRPNRYKVVVPFKGKYFAQAFDGSQGWKIDAFKGETQKTILTGAPARALMNEADVELEPLFIDYRSKGHQAALQGTDTVAGTACYKVVVTRAGGETETYFFDTNTYALVKKTAASKNTELQGALLETTYSDYRQVAGLRLPYRLVSTANGQPILSIILKKVHVNTPVSDAVFKP